MHEMCLEQWSWNVNIVNIQGKCLHAMTTTPNWKKKKQSEQQTLAAAAVYMYIHTLFNAFCRFFSYAS